MNSSFGDLDVANDEMAVTFIPVITLVCVYMIIGLFGNPLVVYYYGFVVAPSPSYYFIVAMAVFDLVICCISMPLEIVDMRYNYKFPSAAACKILRFVNYFASIASGLVLVAIATDRYRKVCCPFGRQITTKMAKIFTGILCVASVSFSWPSFLIYDIHSVNITSFPGLIGYDCTTIRSKTYQLYITLYNGLCFLIFIGCIVTLIVLYTLIGKKLCRLKRFRFSTATKKHSNQMYSPPTSSSEIESQSKLNVRANPRKKQKRSKSKQVDTIQLSTMKENTPIDTFPSATSQSENVIQETKKKKGISDYSNDSGSDVSSGNNQLIVHQGKKSSMLRRKKKIHEKYIHLKKYTLLMLSVSMAFVLSFLPYLGLMTWRTLAPKYEGEFLSNTELVFFNIFLRSWLLASVVNPIIYGFFNADFSHFIGNRLKRICCCWRQDIEQEVTNPKESSHTK